jgi:hypothetical protein
MHLEGITELAQLVTSRVTGLKFTEFPYDFLPQLAKHYTEHLETHKRESYLCV